jgi:phage N-6-adenine-methyltransferase
VSFRTYQMARAGNIARWNRGTSPNPIQRTPDALWRVLDDEFHFTLDAAASSTNAKCDNYFTRGQDGLAQDWGRERVWLNPPFGRGLREWMRKAWEASRGGALVVCLVPSSTDLPWWHEYAMRADEVRFIRGRVVFVAEDGATARNAFFPCSVVIFRPHETGEKESLL